MLAVFMYESMRDWLPSSKDAELSNAFGVLLGRFVCGLPSWNRMNEMLMTVGYDGLRGALDAICKGLMDEEFFKAAQSLGFPVALVDGTVLSSSYKRMSPMDNYKEFKKGGLTTSVFFFQYALEAKLLCYNMVISLATVFLESKHDLKLDIRHAEAIARLKALWHETVMDSWTWTGRSKKDQSQDATDSNDADDAPDYEVQALDEKSNAQAANPSGNGVQAQEENSNAQAGNPPGVGVQAQEENSNAQTSNPSSDGAQNQEENSNAQTSNPSNDGVQTQEGNQDAQDIDIEDELSDEEIAAIFERQEGGQKARKEWEDAHVKATEDYNEAILAAKENAIVLETESEALLANDLVIAGEDESAQNTANASHEARVREIRKKARAAERKLTTQYNKLKRKLDTDFEKCIAKLDKELVEALEAFLEANGGFCSARDKQACEIGGFVLLLKDLEKRYPGVHFLFIMDALYSAKKVIKACKDYRHHYIIRAKQKRIPNMTKPIYNALGGPNSFKIGNTEYAWVTDQEYDGMKYNGAIAIFKDTEACAFLFITDLPINNQDDCIRIIEAGRSRWRVDYPRRNKILDETKRVAQLRHSLTAHLGFSVRSFFSLSSEMTWWKRRGMG
jgi:hypothetical protein